MATQNWPTELPNQLAVGATITTRPVVARVVTDSGVVRMRRRIDGDAGEEIHGDLPLLTRTQMDLLIDFYQRVTMFGVEPFIGLHHPRTDSNMALLGFAAPPVERYPSGTSVEVRLSLETR